VIWHLFFEEAAKVRKKSEIKLPLKNSLDKGQKRWKNPTVVLLRIRRVGGQTILAVKERTDSVRIIRKKSVNFQLEKLLQFIFKVVPAIAAQFILESPRKNFHSQ
jgi:hypothetical protein